MGDATRQKVKITFPEPEPGPPPFTCVLCDEEREYWQRGIHAVAVCWQCHTGRGARIVTRWDRDLSDTDNANMADLDWAVSTLSREAAHAR